jgi:hypothetical protein
MKLSLPLLIASAAAAQTLTVSPSQLNFAAMPGGAPTAPQYVTIQSPVPVQVVAQATDWLRVASEENRLSVVADPSALDLGTYQAKLIVSAENQPSREVAVSLSVSREGQLVISRSEIQVNYSAGQLEGEREISVTSTGEEIPFTTRLRVTGGQNWVALDRNQWETPASLVPRIHADRLRNGVYRAVLTLMAPGGKALDIPITLQVDSLPAIKPEPVTLQFEHYAGAEAPPPQTLSLSSTGRDFSFAVTASGYSRDTIWLAATPIAGSTPASLRVSIDPASLTPGNYRGNIQVQGDARNSPLDVPVSLVVYGDALLQSRPSSLSFAIQPGGQTPALLSLDVFSREPGIGFSAYAQTAQGGDWLATSAPNAKTPGTVIVSLKESARTLAPGRYAGEIILMTGASRVAKRVPVTLNVRTSPVAIAKPGFVDFAFQAGNTAPLSRQVSIEGPPGAQYAVRTSGHRWLTVSAEKIGTGGVLIVTANPQFLQPGKQYASIQLESPDAPDSPVTIPVTADFRGSSLIRATPQALSFRYPSVSTSVQAQNLMIESTGDPVNYDLTFSAQPFGRWLRLSTVTGITPGSVRVEVDPTGLQRGSYSGTIAVTVRGGNTQVVPVTLTIGSGN